jgi:hypothetical protein
MISLAEHISIFKDLQICGSKEFVPRLLREESRFTE